MVNREKPKLDPKQVFNCVGYQFDLQEGQTNPRALEDLKYKDRGIALQTDLSDLTADIPKRIANSQRKTRLPSSAPHTMVLEKQLEGTRITRKRNPYSKVTPPSLKVVASGTKRSSRPNITPPSFMLCKSSQTHQKKDGALT